MSQEYYTLNIMRVWCWTESLNELCAIKCILRVSECDKVRHGDDQISKFLFSREFKVN